MELKAVVALNSNARSFRRLVTAHISIKDGKLWISQLPTEMNDEMFDNLNQAVAKLRADWVKLNPPTEPGLSA